MLLLQFHSMLGTLICLAHVCVLSCMGLPLKGGGYAQKKESCDAHIRGR